MGKERFLKELGLPQEVAEPGEARSEAIKGDSEAKDKEPNPPAEENSDVPEAELEAQQLTEESAEHPAEEPPAKESATKPSEQHEEVEKVQAIPTQIDETKAKEVEAAKGNLGEGGGDEAAPDSDLFLGRRMDDEIEPGRATLAAATVLPLSLLGSKKTWVWIAVLVCLAIVGYLLIRRYSGRGESTSPPKEAVKPSSGDPVRDFLDNFPE